MYVVHDLVRNAAIVLQNVVVLHALCQRDLLGHRQDLGKLIIGDVVELRAVELGDDELSLRQLTLVGHGESRTEWPLEMGPMSRKASVFSDSKSLREGISPDASISACRSSSDLMRTLDDLAKDAGHCGTQNVLC